MLSTPDSAASRPGPARSCQPLYSLLLLHAVHADQLILPGCPLYLPLPLSLCMPAVTEELAKGIDAAWRLAADTAVGSVRQELLAASLGASEGPAAAIASLLLLGLPCLKASASVALPTTPSRPQLLPHPTHSAGGALGGFSGGSLLVQALAESLAALPRLSDERDQEQVEGISRLARALQVQGAVRCGICGSRGQPRLVCRALLRYMFQVLETFSADS